MNKIPYPFLNIKFKPVINDYHNKAIYNSKDNFKKMLAVIENTIISNNEIYFTFYLYNNSKIKAIPTAIDSNYLYLKSKNPIKLAEIQKIRY